MTPDELAAIKARREAATPGPWSATSFGPHPTSIGIYGENEQSGAWRIGLVFRDYRLVPRDQQAEADARFIAHAPTDIAALLAEVERLGMLVANSGQISAVLCAQARAAGFAKAVEMATERACTYCECDAPLTEDGESHLLRDGWEIAPCHAVEIRALRDPEAGDG